MVDIHTHIVYGVDDGPKTIDKSITMIKNATKNRIDEIFLTSHYIDDGYKSSLVEYTRRVRNIKKKLQREHIDVRLYYGSEVMIYPDLDKDINKLFFSLNEGKYVLIELPMFEQCMYVKEVIHKLKQKGYLPIIAHPERYLYAQRNFLILEDLINEGALFQINLGSISGMYGKDAKKIAKKLLKNKMVHFIASDSHLPNVSYENYQQLLSKIKKYIDDNYFNLIVHTFPKCIIENTNIEI